MIYSKHDDQYIHEIKIELISNVDSSDSKLCHGNCEKCRKNQTNKTSQP